MPLAAIADAYTPREIADKVRALGVTKARGNSLAVFVLSVLAGVFIALGATLFIVVVTGSALGFGATRTLCGLVFSLGWCMSSLQALSSSQSTTLWPWPRLHG